MSSGQLRVSTGRPVVIDSSVAFKWFDATESGADVARQLAKEHARDETTLIAPAHLPLEVLNALTCRGMRVPDLHTAVQLLAAVDLLLAPLDDVLLAETIDIASAESVTLYDAAFIALAARLDAELVTADHRQAATARCRVRLL